MARYLIARLLAAVPTLIALTLVAFLLTTAARGDPALEALQQAGDVPSPEALALYRQQLGLDQPLPLRYARWLSGAVRGDLGRSYLARRPVSEMIGERVRATLILGFSAWWPPPCSASGWARSSPCATTPGSTTWGG